MATWLARPLLKIIHFCKFLAFTFLLPLVKGHLSFTAVSHCNFQWPFKTGYTVCEWVENTDNTNYQTDRQTDTLKPSNLFSTSLIHIHIMCVLSRNHWCLYRSSFIANKHFTTSFLSRIDKPASLFIVIQQFYFYGLIGLSTERPCLMMRLKLKSWSQWFPVKCAHFNLKCTKELISTQNC